MPRQDDGRVASGWLAPIPMPQTCHPELWICRAYQTPGHVLTRLQPGPACDLDYQERLTHMLLGAPPIYSPADGDWADVMEQETGARVVLRSHGPTIADKTASEPLSSSRMAA